MEPRTFVRLIAGEGGAGGSSSVSTSGVTYTVKGGAGFGAAGGNGAVVIEEYGGETVKPSPSKARTRFDALAEEMEEPKVLGDVSGYAEIGIVNPVNIVKSVADAKAALSTGGPYVMLVNRGPIPLVDFKFESTNNYDEYETYGGKKERTLLSVTNRVMFTVVGLFSLEDFRDSTLVYPPQRGQVMEPDVFRLEPIRTWAEASATGGVRTRVEAINVLISE